MSVALHATCFHVSALVKLNIEERGNDLLRANWKAQAFGFVAKLRAIDNCKAPDVRQMSAVLEVERTTVAATA